MTYELAVAKQASRPYGEIGIRRDHLRPGGWATRDARRLSEARYRYESSDHGQGIRQFYEGSLRRIAKRLVASYAAIGEQIERLDAEIRDLGVSDLIGDVALAREARRPLRRTKWNRPLSPKAARKFMRAERERMARLEEAYHAAVAQRSGR